MKILFLEKLRDTCATATLACLAAVSMAAEVDVLERVKARDAVRCAVDGTPGFGGLGRDGMPAGFDVDFCRAVAAAALGRADAVQVERISTANKFDALVRGDVDIAFGMATWTYRRDVAMQVRFVAPTFFDGQALMVWSDSPIRKLADARGKRVCVQAGTTTAANLRDLSQSAGLSLVLVEGTSSDDRLNRFMRHDCDLVSGDRSELAALRAVRAVDPGRWRLLDDTLSREPLGPYVVAGDERWFAIVRWVINVTQIAELLDADATRLAADAPARSSDWQALAGRTAGFGAPLGLDDAWARSVVAGVGTYADIFERHVGRGSPLGLERGFNRLWRDGGLFFPPPLH